MQHTTALLHNVIPSENLVNHPNLLHLDPAIRDNIEYIVAINHGSDEIYYVLKDGTRGIIPPVPPAIDASCIIKRIVIPDESRGR